jgi:peptidylprolyl isomerase
VTQVKSGDTVKVHYTGTLEDGTQFDSSVGREPLQFILGAQQVIPGFENAVDGMETGETKTINIPCAEAYGARRDDMMMEVPLDQFPPELTLEVGKQLQMRPENGSPMPVTVAELSDSHATLDANHALAGKDLTFEITLVEIV